MDTGTGVVDTDMEGRGIRGVIVIVGTEGSMRRDMEWGMMRIGEGEGDEDDIRDRGMRV